MRISVIFLLLFNMKGSFKRISAKNSCKTSQMLSSKNQSSTMAQPNQDYYLFEEIFENKYNNSQTAISPQFSFKSPTKHLNRYNTLNGQIGTENPFAVKNQQLNSQLNINNLRYSLKSDKFSLHARNLKQINKVTSDKKKALDKENAVCENHFSQKAKFFLQFEEEKKQNKVWYCRNCAVNLQQQGFQVYPTHKKQKEEEYFVQKLNHFIADLRKSLEKMCFDNYTQEVEKRKEEINRKYEEIGENLMKMKKIQMISIQKIKFELYEEKMKKEKELESILKKLQLLKKSYLKQIFENYKDKEQFYEDILIKEDENLKKEIKRLKKPISFNYSFLTKEQICQRLISIYQNN